MPNTLVEKGATGPGWSGVVLLGKSGHTWGSQGRRVSGILSVGSFQGTPCSTRGPSPGTPAACGVEKLGTGSERPQQA